MRAFVERAERLTGEVAAPGDKSISHRALLFGALGTGTCEVRHLAPGADVRSTAACLRTLGVNIEALEGGAVRVHGVGLGGLKPPSAILDCGNSGTTMRLLSGIVAGSGVGGTLDGDHSLRSRPMRRVLEPLRSMGASARGQASPKGDEVAPLTIDAGHKLRGSQHQLNVSSAQVKSCIILAGLWAEGPTRVREPSPSRDHTERMLSALGVPLRTEVDGTVVLTPPVRPWSLPPVVEVPGDPSTAAFAVGAGVLVPGGRVTVRGVDVNPTRAGFLRVLERMGAKVVQEPGGEVAGDPVATIHAEGGATLRAFTIAPDEVPSLVDEIPLLAVLASQAHGRSEIRGAAELRVKESDRLAQVARGLTAMGAHVQELPDGLIIEGPTPLRAANIDAASDHRIAMSFTVAGLVADGTTTIDGAEWAGISFPGFFELLGQWSGGRVRTA